MVSNLLFCYTDVYMLLEGVLRLLRELESESGLLPLSAAHISDNVCRDDILLQHLIILDPKGFHKQFFLFKLF